MSDFRYACRSLLKTPGFTGVAILALALGIGATTAMFGVIYGFLLRPLPYAQPDRLVMLQSRSTRSGSDLGVNYLDFKDWQEQSRSFSELAFFNLRWNGNLETRDGRDRNAEDHFHHRESLSLVRRCPVSRSRSDAGRRRSGRRQGNADQPSVVVGARAAIPESSGANFDSMAARAPSSA